MTHRALYRRMSRPQKDFVQYNAWDFVAYLARTQAHVTKRAMRDQWRHLRGQQINSCICNDCSARRSSYGK